MLPEPHLRNQFHSTSMVAVPRTMPSQALWSLRTACRAVSAPMLWPPTYTGVPALLPRRTCLEKASRSSTYKITLILACQGCLACFWRCLLAAVTFRAMILP